MATSDQLEIIYDGDCPFCRNLVLKRQIEDKGINVTLTNARHLKPEILEQYRENHFDLNDGMIVKFNSRQYYGHDALLFLLALSEHNNISIQFFEWLYLKLNQKWLYRVLVKIRLLFVSTLK